MGRKVYLTSDVSSDEQLWDIADAEGAAEPLIALLWPWFLPLFDDWGRAKASAKWIKAKAFPGNDLVTIELLEKALTQFAEHGLIQRYEVEGKAYMAVESEKWFRYQTHIRGEKRLKDESPYPPAPGFSLPAPSVREAEEESRAQSRASARDCAQAREEARASVQVREDARENAPHARAPLSPSPSPSETPSPLPTTPAAADTSRAGAREAAAPSEGAAPAGVPPAAAVPDGPDGAEKPRNRSPSENDSHAPVAADPELVEALATARLNRGDALRLAGQKPEECRRQLEFLGYYDPPPKNPGAFLRKAIEDGYAAPPGWYKAQKRQQKAAACHQAAAARQASGEDEARKQKELEEAFQRVRDDPDRFQEICQQARERLAPPLRDKPGEAGTAVLMGQVRALLAEQGWATA